MTFIKWFTGNDLFTPCLSISYSLNKYAVLLPCKDMEVLYMRDVMKQVVTRGSIFALSMPLSNPNPVSVALFSYFLNCRDLSDVRAPSVSPLLWGFGCWGSGGMKEKLVVLRRSPPEKFVGEHQWDLTPGWRSLVLLAMLLGLASGGEEDREWICFFW